MSKYTEEFKRNAIELMKSLGITKASKELKISHCTIYRWCRELEGNTVLEAESNETSENDMDSLMEEQACGSEASSEPHETPVEPDNDENSMAGSEDTVATAMALLVIENTHLREVIRHLRDTISGLTDHQLL